MVEHIVGAWKPRGLFEIRIGVRRRRRWSDKIKGQIVAESYALGAVVSEVARRHGLSPQQLSAWRKAARTSALSLPVDTAPLFVPVMTEERRDDATAAVVPDSRGMSTPENNGALSSHEARGSLGRPGPRHELIETRGRPEIDQLGQHVGEIGLRVDAIKLAVRIVVCCAYQRNHAESMKADLLLWEEANMTGDLIGWVVVLFLASLLAALPLWLAARAVSEGWHSGKLKYARNAKQFGVTI